MPQSRTVQKLAVGEHKLPVTCTDGETSGAFRVLTASSSPAAGDSSIILPHSTILMASLSGRITLILASRKRKKTN